MRMRTVPRAFGADETLVRRFAVAVLAALAILVAGCANTATVKGSTLNAIKERGEIGSRSDYYLFAIEAEQALLRQDFEAAEKAYKAMAEITPEDAGIYRTLAQIRVHQGDLDGAVGYAKKAFDLSPKSVDSAVLYGGLLAARGDVKGATDAYTRALAEDPDNEEIALLVANLFTVNKDFDRARAVLDDLIARQGASALAVFERARLEIVRDDCAAAEPFLRRTLEIDPKFARAEMTLGYCAQERNDEEAAIAHYERALELEPDNSYLRTHLVRMHVQRHNLQDAERENEKLKLFQFDDADVRLNRGLILFYQGRFAEAITEFNLILAADPQNGQALYFLALCLTRQNQPEAAYGAYARIPDSSPYYLDSLAARGGLLRRMGRLDEAEALLRRALQLNPDDTFIMRTLALVVADQGRVKDAVAMLEQALTVTPDDSSLSYVLANIHERAGEWQRAVEIMDAVIVREPKNADALNFVGYTLVEHNTELDRAEGLLKQAVDLRPGDGFITDSYGWLLYRRGKYKDALTHLKRAHELVPDESVIAEHVGDCLKAMGKKKEALEYYKKALELFPEADQKAKLLEKIQQSE